MRTLLLLSCALPLAAQTSAALVDKAKQDLAAGQAQIAVDEYSQAIRLRLDNPDAWAGRGRAYSSLGKYSNAIDDFDQAIRLNPTVALFTDRGFAYGQLGEFDQAVQDLNRALAREPTNVRALSLRGAAYAQLGQHEKALADREEVVRLAPDSAEAYEARGGSYHELGMHEKGLADRTKAIELKPDYEQAWLARGSAYFLLGRYFEAIGDLTEALRLKPDDTEATTVLTKVRGIVAAAHSETVHVTLSAQELTKLLRPDPYLGFYHAPLPQELDVPKAAPVSPAQHNQRGRELLYAGKYRESVDELTAAIAADPSMALAYNARGFAYYLSRDYPHALADFDKAIELMPGYQNAISNRALARKAAAAAQPAK